MTADFPVRNEAERRERLVVVSNRLPFTFRRDEEGRWRAEPAGGGLVTALLPVLRHRGGMWIGWTGARGEDAELDGCARRRGRGRGLHAEGRAAHRGGSARLLPRLLQRDRVAALPRPAVALQLRARVLAHLLRRSIARYAEAVARERDAGRFHLGARLPPDERGGRAAPRRRRARASGFFLHIPFPPPDLFLKLPWRMRGAARAARVRPDRLSDAARPPQLRAVRARAREGRRDRGARARCCSCRPWGASCASAAFPISIDYNTFMRQAAAPGGRRARARAAPPAARSAS